MNKKKYMKIILYLIFKKLFFNKYFITSFCFFIWMFFFDTHSILKHYKLNKEIKKFENEKIQLKNNIKHNTHIYNLLINNKYKKEHYINFFYKKNNN